MWLMEASTWHINIRMIHDCKPKFLGCLLQYWVAEPEREILMLTWSFGPLLTNGRVSRGYGAMQGLY